MIDAPRREPYDIFLWLLVGGFLLFNGLTLTVYPRVFDGNDEALFAKQAYLLYTQGLPFFDANLSNTGVFRGVAFFPQHGLLTIGLLSVLGRFFGFGILAMRMLPLVCSAACLVLTYRVARRLLRDTRAAFYGAFVLACNWQFIASAHWLRPEPLLTALLLVIFYMVLRGVESAKPSWFWMAAFVAGVSPSAHLNGAIVSPVLLFGSVWLLTRWHGDDGRPVVSFMLVLQLLAFVAVGAAVFMAFHYLPYRADYWHTFSFGLAYGSGYQDLLANIPRTLARSLYLLPQYHWNSRYHTRMFPFALYALALIGGVLQRSSTHTLLLRVCLVLWLPLQALHFYPAYYEYILPFISMLLASVLCQLSAAVPRPVSMAFLAALPLSAMSIVAVYVHENPPWPASQLRAVTERIGDTSKVLAPYNFFFAGIPPENLFSLGYGDWNPESLMREKRIPYLILYKGAADPMPPLSSHCRQELVLRQTPDKGDQILLFKCGGGSWQP